MTLRTQILAAGFLLVALAAGTTWYLLSDRQSTASAAIRSERTVPVETSTVVEGTVTSVVEAVGSTLARRAVDIVAMASGRVAEIAFEPGQEVDPGAILIRLDNRAERAAVAEAEAELTEARLALERARQLRRGNTIAQATVDELEAAYLAAEARLARVQKDLDDRSIQAPFPGVVGMRRVDIGAQVDNDTVLTTLDDLEEVEIEFAVPEVFYGAIRLGQTVSASSSAFPEQIFEGKVSTIDSRIDPIARAFKVRAVLPNPDLVLPAGMFMLVRVVLEERTTLLIPEEAVVAEGEATFVFTIDEGTAFRRDVDLGQREVGEVEVLGGLEGGEQVVVKGVHRLRDGAPVDIRDPDAAGSAPLGGQHPVGPESGARSSA